MPFFGFGQFSSVMTGVYAAQDILGIGNYEKLSQKMRHAYENSLVLSRTMEKLDNAKLDFIVQNFSSSLFPFIKRLPTLLI